MQRATPVPPDVLQSPHVRPDGMGHHAGQSKHLWRPPVHTKTRETARLCQARTDRSARGGV